MIALTVCLIELTDPGLYSVENPTRLTPFAMFDDAHYVPTEKDAIFLRALRVLRGR